MTSTVLMAALLTSAQADFSLGAFYDEMKEVIVSLGEDRPDAETAKTVTVAATTQATTETAVETH